MKSKAAVPLLVGLFLVLLAAGLIGSSVKDRSTAAAATGNPLLSNTAAAVAEQVFPKDKVIDVKITMDAADFQDILDNASLEEYKTASVEYNGVTLNNVGIRAKGNLSLRSVVQSDSDRYSFKLSFDEYVSSQTLNGISKINLNNNYSDAASMREFLTYELAEKIGLPTPGYSYVNVYVNGSLWGFYLSVEQVGDAYLERNFGNSYGALYKGEMTGSGSDLTWLGEDVASYSGLAQKSKSSNDDIVVDMINELNNGMDYESVLNVDNVLKYIALNAVTDNMDSYLGSNKQNYYLYEDNGIFNVLPWDYNMAFSGMGRSGTVYIDEPTQGAVAERPLIAKLLAVDEYKERYHEILRGIVEGYMSDASFQQRVDEISELISPYVEKDPRPFYNYEAYQQGVTQLKSTASNLAKNIVSQLDGTTASTNGGNGSGNGMGGGFGGGGGRMNGGGGGNGGGMRGGGMGMPGNGQNTQQTGGVTQDGQTAQQEAAPSQAGQTAQQGAAPGQAGQTAQQGAAPGQAGQTGQQEAAPNQAGQTGQQGAAPNQAGQSMQQGGQMPGFAGGGGGFPGGMGQPGTQTATAVGAKGSASEAATSGVLILILLAACLFVAFYKRQR